MKNRYFFLSILVFILVSVNLTGCSSNKKIHKVGILTLLSAMDPIVTGFKSGMVERGYTEGDTIEYFYYGPANEVGNLDAQAQQLIDNDVELIVAVTTPGAQAAQRAVQGTGIPVVFIAVTDPIASGLVTDLSNHPENITGILAGAKSAQSDGRRLEIFLQVVPGVKMLYMPFNPDDPAAMESVNAIRSAANTLGVTLIEAPIHNEEEALNALTPPEQVDGVFLPNDRLVGSVIDKFLTEANKQKLPTSLNNPAGLSSGALLAYGPDFTSMGEQAARLTSQIFTGTSASDLPVEVPDLFIGLNLQIAELIDLHLPDEIIRLASIIVR